MRNAFYLALLGVILLTIALVVRSGIFIWHTPSQPMNKYVREEMNTVATPQLSTQEALVIDRKYDTAYRVPSGIRYLVRAPGKGDAKPRAGQTVTIQYVVRRLLDGKVIDSSFEAGRPYTFVVGSGRVIAGLDDAVRIMKKGEKLTAIIPWWLAYGDKGRPPREPPKTSLVFDIQLVDFH